MSKRSDRLKQVVKQSGKTARQILNTFQEIEKNDPRKIIKYPKDPITISRHLNNKRTFDIDTAIAYGKALDADPGEICFEPVLKMVRGYIDPLEKENPWKVNWYSTKENFNEFNTVRVPREFYSTKFRILEVKSVTNNRHGMIFIYEKINENYANPRSFNQMGLCELNNNNYVVAVPVPSGKKNNFTITDMASNILYREKEILSIHPIVSCLFPAFFKNY